MTRVALRYQREPEDAGTSWFRTTSGAETRVRIVWTTR